MFDSEKIDVLANVAGIIDSFESADVITDDAWDRVIAINLTVPTKLIRAVLPFMRAKRNGSIINVCSKAALSGAASGVAYTAVSRTTLHYISPLSRIKIGSGDFASENWGISSFLFQLSLKLPQIQQLIQNLVLV